MRTAITEKNRARIETYIAEAEGKATVRKLSFDAIVKALVKVEQKLDIAKKDMEGTIAIIDVNAQDFPSAYKYRPASTIFEAVKTKSGWTLLDVWRDDCRRYNAGAHLQLPDNVKQAVIKRLDSFSI
jgi:hypothetical protein